jgi:DNA-binding LacI/PurR family transcriptional regulator
VNGSTSKAASILSFHNEGASITEIARRAGCTVENVCNTLRKKGAWNGTKIARVTPSANEYVCREAKKHGVTPAEMARSLLNDAIYDATGGK